MRAAEPPSFDAASGGRVSVPVMAQRWESVSFVHWSYPASAVQPLLPRGLRVEQYDGRAWVGLVPFHMTVGPPGVRRVPWLGEFHETNVRTYVTDSHGRRGVWFFSLDAQRLAAVVAARAVYAVPYFWSDLTLTRAADVVSYTCRRRWPGRDVRSRLVVELGQPYEDAELSELDHFLTARFTLFAARFGRIVRTAVAHPPWPLRQARVRVLHDQLDGLVRRAGLPAPAEPPLAHFSEGVDVSAGPPRLR